MLVTQQLHSTQMYRSLSQLWKWHLESKLVWSGWKKKKYIFCYDHRIKMTCLSLIEITSLWVESPMFSASSHVSLLRRQGSHSPGQLFSLSLIQAEDGWSRFSLSKADQLIQQLWIQCNFWMAQSHAACLMEITSTLDA